MTLAFNDAVIGSIKGRDDQAVMHYENYRYHEYAVLTPEHFLPLIYVLGAAKGEPAEIFNNHCELGAISMTGFVFGL